MYNKINKVLISGLIDEALLEKVLKNISHLVPKKIQVKGKDGKMYMAIRWVDPTTGLPEKHAKQSKINVSGEIEDKVLAITNSDKSSADKARALINQGIYDKDIINLLSGFSDANYYLKKESEIDVSSLKEDKSGEIKEAIAKQQEHNSTPEELEANPILVARDLDKVWENYERNLTRVIKGRHKFAMAYGTGGVGKTFTFRKLAKELNLREFDDEIQPEKDQYDYVVVSGKISPAQVYAEMYRHKDKLIVFDDCDSFLKMEEVQGFLKAGLDTGGDTKISNKSSIQMYKIQGDKESGKIPNTFRFNGRVIAITNLNAQDIDQAVRSRAMISNLTMTVDETIDKLGSIKDKIQVYSADKLEILNVRPEARDIAMEAITASKNLLGGDINTRIYSNAALISEDGFDFGDSHDQIKESILNYFNDVKGTFDADVRNTTKKK